MLTRRPSKSALPSAERSGIHVEFGRQLRLGQPSALPVLDQTLSQVARRRTWVVAQEPDHAWPAA